MAKYRGAYREEEDDASYSEELAAEQPTEGEPAEEEPANSEEATFKKRYGDLRRHSQQREQQLQQQIDQMKEQLEDATKKQIRFPKTDEEIEEWTKKYPHVADIVDTIARKRATEAMEEGEKRLKSLRELEQKLTRKEAEQELFRLHPDFADIRADEAFHQWVDEQPKWVVDALYVNNTDPYAAARAIDLYKADTGKGTTKRKNKDDPKDAAREVPRSRSAQPSSTDRPKFSESQVSRMTDREYEENEKAILAAIKDGKFEYDITGAAR